MGSPPLDFESSASTYFTTPAKLTRDTTLKKLKVNFRLSIGAAMSKYRIAAMSECRIAAVRYIGISNFRNIDKKIGGKKMTA